MPLDAVREPAGWLASEWSGSLAAAIEMMTESRPTVHPGRQRSEPASGALWFSLPFTVGPGAAVFAGADEPVWTEIARSALSAAGLTELTPADLRATYREILTQAAAGLARSLSQRLGIPVSPLPPAEVGSADCAGAVTIEISSGDPSPRELWLGWNASLEAALSGAAVPARAGTQRSQTLDLLMEVELPVSVSFGRAELPLRDVLKLNSGSIVELNRTISDPVEVIVNNCVIARGEVVVVDGNYGVRIHQVISREERLRTLK